MALTHRLHGCYGAAALQSRDLFFFLLLLTLSVTLSTFFVFFCFCVSSIFNRTGLTALSMCAQEFCRPTQQ